MHEAGAGPPAARFPTPTRAPPKALAPAAAARLKDAAAASGPQVSMKCFSMNAAKAALQKCPKCPQKAAMKCKAAKAMKVGRPRKCSKVKKAMKVAECSKVKPRHLW